MSPLGDPPVDTPAGNSTSMNWDNFTIGDPPPDAKWYRCLHEPTAEARIVATPDTLGGSPRLDGTRMSVKLLLDLLSEDVTPEKASEMYPNLPEGWADLLRALRPVLRRKYRDAF